MAQPSLLIVAGGGCLWRSATTWTVFELNDRKQWQNWRWGTKNTFISFFTAFKSTYVQSVLWFYDEFNIYFYLDSIMVSHFSSLSRSWMDFAWWETSPSPKSWEGTLERPRLPSATLKIAQKAKTIVKSPFITQQLASDKVWLKWKHTRFRKLLFHLMKPTE